MLPSVKYPDLPGLPWFLSVSKFTNNLKSFLAFLIFKYPKLSLKLSVLGSFYKVFLKTLGMFTVLLIFTKQLRKISQNLLKLFEIYFLFTFFTRKFKIVRNFYDSVHYEKSCLKP